MNIEQLQEKHFKVIEQNTYGCFDTFLSNKGITELRNTASSSCTQITLQAIRDVLEGCIDEDFTRKTEGNVYAKIKEIELLIKK